MAEIATLVQRYLVLSAKPKRLNLYTILGLDELLQDRKTIADAVESAIEKLKSADRTSDPAGFEQVVKVVRQARATLLDDEKKRAYDAQLKASLTKKPVSAAAPTPPSESLSSISAFFPPGDPSAPFSMADFLKRPAEQPELETSAERHVAIAELVRSGQPTSRNEIQPSHVPENLDRAPATNGSLLNLERPVTGRNAGRELQEMIRRNRRKKNAIAAGIAIGSSLVVVLVGVWMFVSNRMEQSRQIAKNANGSSLANKFQPNAMDSNNATEENEVADEANPSRMNLGVTPQTNEKLGPLPKLGIDDQASMVPAEAVDTSIPPPEPISVPDPIASEPMKVPEVSVDSKMVEDTSNVKNANASAAEWVEAMNAARKTLGQRDFAKFSTEIQKALDLSETDSREEQARRLDRFGQLYEKGLAAANEAFAALKSSDEIKYGSAGGKAAVVESSENVLVLRISGKNERFPYDKIPMGILMAVVEPKMGDTAIDHAIRGILLHADARSNSANKKQAKGHFEKAASMDESFSKLDLVLEEKYQ